ncbi:MAG: arsenate reductase ArsC [Planctomycetes bacterium]|nr:arsenate reductase ArsC [Planctomycetota bacterium]
MTSKILFVCIHNSARSQMAEAFVTHHCGDRFEASSAGLEPGTLNPMVVAAMRERGIDISRNTTKSVSEILAANRRFDYVVTVCDEASAERCPVFPGNAQRLHWGFPDPSALQGSPETRLQGTRVIRDQIESRITEWCQRACAP